MGPVYGRHAGLWPFEKISPLLVRSVLTYRSEPAQLRHAWIEKAIVLPSGDDVVLENPAACARIFSSDPSAFAIPRIPATAHLQSNQLLRADYMTPDERAQLIEDIRRSTASRERIVERASADKEFDIAAAWETVEELDRSIYTRILRARSK